MAQVQILAPANPNANVQQKKDDQNLPPRVVANYIIGDILGSGVSGITYVARHVYNGQFVALKLQRVGVAYPTNPHERTIYPQLQGGTGMPTLWAGGVAGSYDYLAMDLLGASLDGLWKGIERRPFDLRTVCCVAVQLISRLEFMHSRGILHRDIQLGNIAVGLPPHDGVLYMIDFGFAKPYVNQKTRKHITDTKQAYFTGNYWFSSINTHCKMKAHARRDDLEAAALMLIHMLTPGGLPWTRNGIPKNEHGHRRLKKAKRDTQPQDLCRGLPEEFEAFLRYCRSLPFAACPDYVAWRGQFRDLANDLGFEDIERFVWPPPQMPARVSQPRPAQQIEKNAQPAMSQILDDLANMRLDDRPVLGDKKNVAPTPAPIANGNAAAKPPKKSSPPGVIVISSDEEENRPVRTRTTKAAGLGQLTKKVALATDNATLGALVGEFAALLQSSSSRVLTKEGFAFLDALHKQLADPSVFLLPLRTSRTKAAGASLAPASQPSERHSRLWALRVGVRRAENNGALAALVAEFGTLTDRTAGRKLTKDGFSFLEGLAEQLAVVQ